MSAKLSDADKALLKSYFLKGGADGAKAGDDKKADDKDADEKKSDEKKAETAGAKK
jgi:hypothetical protein